MAHEHNTGQDSSRDSNHDAGKHDTSQQNAGAIAAAPADDAETREPAPSSEAAHAGAGAGDTPIRVVAQAMILPLFFVLMFSLCYVSAFHHPIPRDVGLVVVGPDAATSQIAAGIEQSSPGSFEVTTSTDLAGALDQLASQKTAGVLELGQELTVHVASGSGSLVAQTVERVAQGIAASSGLPLAIDDLSPLSAGDSTGTALFYFLIIATIGGYLSITVLSQVAPRMAVGRQLKVLGVMGTLLTLVSFGISSIFVGLYNASLPAVLITIAVGIAYTIIVGMVSIFFNKLLGRAAIFVVMSFAIFVNFPSAGGAIPASFLPPFWEAVHSFWIGSGAMQSMRSVIYFDGHGLGNGLIILGAWLVLAAAALFAIARRDKAVPVAPANEEKNEVLTPAGSGV
ncbi:ABC transporter permease [Rhodococcoides yunnanense]|uniref:ABC transporter permease n=1 Tax=Rhodococcoides yunnanense TaxID=278209 RepID=UPI000935601E|nr:ABC transporter permease [Rhodococcus yunnanensis]